MILIITHKTDFTADFVIHKLNQQEIPYRRLNCEDLLDNTYSIEINDEFKFALLGEKEYKSIWFRRTKLPQLNGLSKEDELYTLNELDNFFKNLFETLDTRWLSKPHFVYKAENKLYQLKIAKGVGFRIPETLVTNNKQKVIDFYYRLKSKVIIKPISSTRIISPNGNSFIFTNAISENLILNLDKYDLTPCIFQENIEKAFEIRVTVVNTSVFAAVVYSQDYNESKQDWRRKKLKFHKFELPIFVKEKCIRLCQELNLKFGAIDLIKTPNDDYVFLEINPNGQWAWIETQTGLPISNAIIKYLSNHE